MHCAGGSETIGPVTQIDSEAWRRTVDLNINGTMYVLKHAAREMVRGGGGSFIGISSIAASNTHRWFGAYGVSKAGIDHLMQLAADELGPSWVRVNCIRPGLIRTELVAPVLDSPELSADYAAITPLPRPGEVEDIANAAIFLLSDAASYITGQVINVDGGVMVRRGPDYSAMLEPSSVPTGCAASCRASDRVGLGSRRPPMRPARRPPTSRGRAPPRASRVRKRSRSRLATGIGTCSSSAAASTRRMSFCPSDAAKPAGSNCSPAISPP